MNAGGFAVDLDPGYRRLSGNTPAAGDTAIRYPPSNVSLEKKEKAVAGALDIGPLFTFTPLPMSNPVNFHASPRGAASLEIPAVVDGGGGGGLPTGTSGCSSASHNSVARLILAAVTLLRGSEPGSSPGDAPLADGRTMDALNQVEPVPSPTR
ncbi:hypothetical protein EYF80_041559 [Liparis tanakae]|uniref:Uncharacterized protein n=1 Tax=Liparis tanakae TaxID=230148 RepID=A0A4Z2G586_9TELE|nr:hypothetical protein EYF80_041559 [Liparis tanakae]